MLYHKKTFKTNSNQYHIQIWIWEKKTLKYWVTRFFGLHSTETFVYSKFIWKRIMDHLDTLWFPGWWLMFTQLKHIPSRELPHPTKREGENYFSKWLLMGYVSSQEGSHVKVGWFPPSIEAGFPKTKKCLTKTPIRWSWWHPFCSTTPEILRLCPSAAGILFDPQDRIENQHLRVIQSMSSDAQMSQTQWTLELESSYFWG